MSDSIHFFYEEIPFRLPDPKQTSQWIINVIQSSHKQIGNINYIFFSVQYIHSINKERLGHDYYTDIITFDQSDEGDVGLHPIRLLSHPGRSPRSRRRCFGKGHRLHAGRVRSHRRERLF